MADYDDDDDRDLDETEEDEFDDEADDDEVEDADEDSALEDEDEPEEKPRRKPKVTTLTLVLIFLNLLAGGGFVFLLLMNYEKRQAFTFAALAHEAHLVGAGLDEDRKGATAATVTLPKPRLSSDELRAALSSRGGTPGSEPLAAVEKGLPYHVHQAELRPEARRELFSDVGEPVASIEEELLRLKSKIVGDIEDVGKQMVAKYKDDAAKRGKAALLLLPLCFDTFQIEKLNTRIARSQGAQLDALLADAAQRRIIADILNPVEVVRPGDPDKLFIEKVCDPEVITLEQLRDKLTGRLQNAASGKHDGEYFLGEKWEGQPRFTVEKREAAAFLLTSIGYARKHLDPSAKFDEQLLYPRGLDRAQRICGVYSFTLAAEQLAEAFAKLQDRVQRALTVDREGYEISVNNQLKRSEGFIDQHADAVRRIQDLRLVIRKAEHQLEDLKDQAGKAKKLYEERLAHLKDVQDRILKARASTATLAGELDKLQKELFQAELKLAEAGNINARLERQIRQLSSGKGFAP